jgi:hypothetical protein
MVTQMAKNFLTVSGNPKILYCHNSPQQVTILSNIIASVTQLRTRPRIPSEIPRIACGGWSFLTLVLPVSTGRLSLVTPSNPPPCLKFYFCAFKVTVGLVRSYVTLAIIQSTSSCTMHLTSIFNSFPLF